MTYIPSELNVEGIEAEVEIERTDEEQALLQHDSNGSRNDQSDIDTIQS